MANKLYEEESIRAIADAIRQSAPGLAGNRTFKVEEMADAISYNVCDEQYDTGYRKGYDSGTENVKTTEAKDNSNVRLNFNVPNTSVVVTAPSGYYADGINKEIDADPIYDKGFDEGVETVKTEEAKTGDDIVTVLDTQGRTVNTTIPQGYYAETVNSTFDASPLYDSGWEEGYEEGLAQGGGSVDTTTVWELNALPDVKGLPNTDIFFASNEMKFSQINKIYIDGLSNKQSIRYVGSSTQTVYTVSSGWSNQAYRTITIHEEITDENLLAWLQTNATLISGGSGGGGGSSEDLEALGALCDWSIMTDTSSIPLICLVNYHPTYYMCCTVYTDSGDIPYYYDENGDEVYPEYGEVVVAPNSVLDLTFDYPMSSMGGIYVENVRWTRDGTI